MASYDTLTGFVLQADPLQERLNTLVHEGQVEVIDPDILRLPEGIIEFRTGDQYRITFDALTGEYRREWPSRLAYEREAARELLNTEGKK